MELAFPGAEERLRGAWHIAGERLYLDRIWLQDGDGPDADLAWGILFTGLKAPLPAFWLDGLLIERPPACGPDSPEFWDDHWLQVELERGKILKRLNERYRKPRTGLLAREDHEMPLAYRLLVLLLLVPVGPVMMALSIVAPKLMREDLPLKLRLLRLLSTPSHVLVHGWYFMQGRKDDGEDLHWLRKPIAWFDRQVVKEDDRIRASVLELERTQARQQQLREDEHGRA